MVVSESAGRVGRPAAGAAESIDDRLLERVWRLYVEGGYANVSYDAIAAAERMSKRTIYARHPSKDALFRAAVARKFADWLSENRLAVDSRFEDPVAAFVELTLRVLLTPDAFAMSRILRGEEGRFPDLAELARAGLDRAVDRLADLLAVDCSADRDIGPRERAQGIMDMLVGRAMSLGAIANKGERSARLEAQLPTLLQIVSLIVSWS